MHDANRINRRLLLVLAAAAVLAAVALLLLRFWPASGQPVAVISVGSHELYRIPLLEAEDQMLSLEDRGLPVHFQVIHHQIRFYQVTCPDHICEQSGFLGQVGEMAVCMPNRVTLVIRSSE